MRSVHLRGPALATLGVAAILVVATVATPTSAGASGTQKVQVPQHLCKTATAGHKSCDAIRVVTRRVSNAKAAQLKAAGVARPAKTRLGFGPAGGYTPSAGQGLRHQPGNRTRSTVAIINWYNDPYVGSTSTSSTSTTGCRPRRPLVPRRQPEARPSRCPARLPGASEITLDVQASARSATLPHPARRGRQHRTPTSATRSTRR